MVFIGPTTPGFPAPIGLFPVLSTALVIAAGVGGEPKYSGLLTNRVSTFIGEISYSLYLWHWPVIILLLTVIAGRTPLYYAAAAVLTAGLSYVSYRFVETPLRSNSWREMLFGKAKTISLPQRRTRWVTLGLVTAGIFSLAFVGSTYAYDRFNPDETAGQPPYEYVPGQPLSAESACIGANTAEVDRSYCEELVGRKLYTDLNTFQIDMGNAFECWRDETEATFPNCHLGPDDTTTRIAMVGDSHVASLLPAMELLADKNNWRVDIFTGWGCKWATFDKDADCGPAMAAAQAQLLETKCDAIVTTGARQYYESDFKDPIGSSLKAWEPLVKSGTEVVVIEDVPGLEQDVMDCMQRATFNTANNNCITPFDIAFKHSDPLIEISKKLPGTHFVKLSDYFCTDDGCPVVVGNILVYRDTHGHITPDFARTLAPVLDREISRALQPQKKPDH